MADFISAFEAIIHSIVELSVILLELFGVCILIVTAVQCFYRWTKHDIEMRLDLAQGIALALEFKMGGEVLRTVVVREWKELGILGVIIVLRGLLTFLIHWEIKHEEQALEKKIKSP